MPNPTDNPQPPSLRRALIALGVMAFLTPLAVWFLGRIHMHNDAVGWLPTGDREAKIFHWYRGHFPIEDRVLVSWDGSSLDDPRVDALAARLLGTRDEDGVRHGGSPYVTDVATPRELIGRMLRYDIPAKEAVDRVTGVLIGPGPLKLQFADAGRRQQPQALTALRQRIHAEFGYDIEIVDPEHEAGTRRTGRQPRSSDIDAANGPVAADDDPGTVHADRLAALDEWLATERPFDVQIRWPAMHSSRQQVQVVRELVLAMRSEPSRDFPDGELLFEDAFLVPGTPAAIAVTLSEPGSADVKDSLALIIREANAVGVDSTVVHYGGRPVASHALNSSVKQIAWNRAAPIWNLPLRSPLLFCSLVGFLLTFLMLRSLRLATLVQFASLYTVMLSVAVVPATNGSMNMVLVVMPSLVLVLTISAAIHVSNYWKHAARENPSTAITVAISRATLPCLLASLTTAIGLLSLTTSSLLPVRDFGVYSAIGCVISLLVILYGFPALLRLWPPRNSSELAVNDAPWRRLADRVTQHSTAVTSVCLLGGAVSVAGLQHFHTETKVIRYFPEDSKITRDYTFLEDRLAGIVPVDTVVRFDEQAQDDLNFLERMEVVRNVQRQISAHPEISGTLSLATFQPVENAPPKSASIFIRARYNKKASTMESRIRESDSDNIRRFVAYADEPVDLVEPGDHRLNQAGDEMWRITSQVAIMTDLNYGELTHHISEITANELAQHNGATHEVTGMVPVILRTQEAVLESLIRSFAIAFVIIAIVMMVLLRSALAGLITMIPNLLPVGVVFGLTSWFRVPVDIGTMITASVALGIAVDGTLHLLTWFRSNMDEGQSRSDAIANAMAHCGPALSQTSIAVGIGMLTLYPTELLLISRFGWLMSALIFAALVADLILLPALLAGPLGSLIDKSGSSRKKTAAPNAGTAAPNAGTAAPVAVLPEPHMLSQATRSPRR